LVSGGETLELTVAARRFLRLRGERTVGVVGMAASVAGQLFRFFITVVLSTG